MGGGHSGTRRGWVSGGGWGSGNVRRARRERGSTRCERNEMGGCKKRTRSHTNTRHEQHHTIHDKSNTTNDHTKNRPSLCKKINSELGVVGCKIPRKENSPMF